MGYVKLQEPHLRAFCQDAFEGFGFDREEARIITDVLLLADLYGIESHGVQRLVRYHQGIMKKSIRVDAKPEIVFETPVSAVIDGHSGMGQVIGYFANQLAIEKAKAAGMAFVTVRNSNHYGIAGYYSKMACDAGLIGISMTNSESIAVHTNARQAVLGSNPIAFAMPADPYPFWFDAATTVVPRGKLEVYKKADKPLQEGWAIDEEGHVTDSADRALQCIINKNGGGILPLGGNREEMGSHKGYGFSMICEILCAIASGGATSNHHVRKPGEGAGTCHSFVVIDPKIFGNPQEMKDSLSVFMQELRDAKRADEQVQIYTHGEKEAIRYQEKLKNGIDVNENTVKEMQDLCHDLSMDLASYFDEGELLK
ncbi:MAG: Ldh family oxidoreductase [Clostridiales bacterium]|nr:Ldh family oxidoreductase [Clostridiales bacterium]